LGPKCPVTADVTPQCSHLSSHFCISNTTINLILELICCRFRSGRP